LGLTPASASETVEANLEAVGHTDLGRTATYGDVAVVGTSAVVASDGSACSASVEVVDVKDAKRPKVASTIELPPGTAAADIDAVHIGTDGFTGDMVAVALSASPGCPAREAGTILFYDLTDPAAPRLLARTTGCRDCPSGAVSVAQRADGRVLLLWLDGPGSVAVDELTDPSRPAPIGRWAAPAGAACPVGGRPVSVTLHDDGQGALVVLSDGRVYELDLSDPAQPSGTGTERPSRSTYGAVMPVGRRTLAVVADEGRHEACGPGETETRGLRLLELDRGAGLREVEGVRFPSPAAPGRLVASGELVYATWHADGLRVVDLGQVRPRTVAQFIPAAADVVGVALLAEHIVVTDRTSGLYVLQRPDEGGGRSSFWSDLVGVLPYLGFAGILAAAFVIPRLAMGRAPQGTSVPSPTPARVPRRRSG
jgi:hypothetical protein